MGLSICVASAGRSTLLRTVQTIVSQMQPGDELLVDVNADGDFGNSARTRMMAKATGTHLMFIDDDDFYAPDALATVRTKVSGNPERVHMFRMEYDTGNVLWRTPELTFANISTQMIVTPNSRLGAWGDRYEGDFDFITSTCANHGEPVWHEEIIAMIHSHDIEYR